MPRKISDECLHDFLEEGFTQSEIGRACCLSRQAVHKRINYKKSTNGRLNSFSTLFLRRLGFSINEIAEYMNVSYHAIYRRLIVRNFLVRTYPYPFVYFAYHKRWRSNK